jgi:signal transduction histidine kinase
MKAPIRLRYFAWLAVMLVLYSSVQILTFLANELHEWRTEAVYNLEEEVEEFLLIVGMHVVSLPIMLLVIWRLSKRMLRPLAQISSTAEKIGSGRLKERIPVYHPGDELGILAETINRAFDRYQDAVDRLNRFSGDASHQLRTPLTAIRSMGEVALQRDRTAEQYREVLSDMLEEVQRLSHIAEQLLLLSRLELPDLARQFAEVNLSNIVRRVCSQYEPVCADRRLTLRLQIPETARVRGDPALLEQVAANLIDNAVKYSPAGGAIEVEVANADPRGVVLCVRDNGLGIPPAFTRRVFERFSRAVANDYPGAGLGLAIVSDIVKIHSGTVTARPNTPSGSTFEVVLPAGLK